MSQKLVARIANGLGNQLFIYASAYAFAKQLNRELLIDEKSGFLNEERKIKYELSYFNISSKLSENKYKFDNQLKNIKRFLLKKIEKFSKTKNFLIEDRNNKKETEFSNNYLKRSYKDVVFLEGYFQSEKYFINYKNNIIQEFSFKDQIKTHNLELQKMILNSNSILVHIRQHAFSETQKKQTKKELAKKIGATHTFNSSKCDVRQEILNILEDTGADVVVDNTGNTEVIQLAYEITQSQGRTILVGVPRKGDHVSIYSLPLHFGKVLTGSQGGETQPSRDIPRFIM